MFAIRLGFTEIKELDEYVGLKCLYLECNAISEISGLEKQTELRCLLLHNNVIKVHILPFPFNQLSPICRSYRKSRT